MSSDGLRKQATARRVGVGWHVGSHIGSAVDLSKWCAGQNRGVPQLLIVSQCLREGRKASPIEEACQERGQVGGQVGMGHAPEPGHRQQESWCSR